MGLDPQSRVLIVDDFELMRTMLKRALGAFGFTNFTEAADSNVADQLMVEATVTRRPFSLVFLDWNLPGSTGYDLLCKWRGNPRLAELAIIMVTSESDREKVQAALKAGANDYICKPISIDKLKEKLEAVGLGKVRSA
ncbi:MAG: response regulator [Bdellovibrionales bacterium]|nr:response regulator [Bdellovibrionales bacterium]